MSGEAFVFVDNSNLWIEGKKISGKRQSPPVDSNYFYRVEYGKLLTHVLQGRAVGGMPQLYGSEPPPNDSVWKIIRSKGYDVNVFKRNFFGKEKGVDMRLGMDVAKLIYRDHPTPATVVIVAGDADFVPVVDDVGAAGWIVEVWYWLHAAEALRAAAGSGFHSMDGDLYTVGFDAGS